MQIAAEGVGVLGEVFANSTNQNVKLSFDPFCKMTQSGGGAARRAHQRLHRFAAAAGADK